MSIISSHFVRLGDSAFGEGLLSLCLAPIVHVVQHSRRGVMGVDPVIRGGRRSCRRLTVKCQGRNMVGEGGAWQKAGTQPQTCIQVPCTQLVLRFFYFLASFRQPAVAAVATAAAATAPPGMSGVESRAAPPRGRGQSPEPYSCSVNNTK